MIYRYEKGGTEMNCWTCGALLDDSMGRKISFRAVCDHCLAALHCCKNCKYYKPGVSNDCLVPRTEYVADRTANNFCEEFSILGKSPSVKPLDKTKPFDDLFKF